MILTTEQLLRKAKLKLLEIKDSQIRISMLKQANEAVDKGIHVGGAFSATIPLVTFFYGQVADIDIVNPTRRGQDMFVLSKGHAVALLASIYADLGYFDVAILENSRSSESILNGHPGPILPGIHISTGPLGQGLGVAQGFALIGKTSPNFDVFCMVGDGELQEGPVWEAVMYSSFKKLDNLCVLIDKNAGQLDDTKQLIFPMLNLDKRFSSFGWKVLNIDATKYDSMLSALLEFKHSLRDGRPTVIICRARKGYGGFSDFMVGHKVTLKAELTDQEIIQQEIRRRNRISEFVEIYNSIDANWGNGKICEKLNLLAQKMSLEIVCNKKMDTEVRFQTAPVKTKPAAVRDKKIIYDESLLPQLNKTQNYSCSSVITQAMKVFAQDPRVVSIDADLASTSGLEAGVGYVDMARGLNVGVAEANMMCVGEAFAAMGYNTWVSTFCPFFDWKVLRRIAIGQQERLEAIKMEGGWLSEGHALDLTFLATAPNFETQTNGATHMGNDDVLVFDGIAHLKIIDISCPNQLLGLMKWIMEGNKGLVYARIMRAASPVVYDQSFEFEFGKGYVLKENSKDQSVIVSSGRGTHEALMAAQQLEEFGLSVGVVDMPSIDETLLISLYDSGKLIVIAEQNNGYIWSEYQKLLFRKKESIETRRIVPINTLYKNCRPQFIHSGTYPQLIEQFGLAPIQLAEKIKGLIL